LIKKWNPKFEIEYQAAYHFGDSEWETKLILIASLDKWYAQIESGSWSGSGSNLAWVYSYENLTNVKVDATMYKKHKWFIGLRNICTFNQLRQICDLTVCIKTLNLCQNANLAQCNLTGKSFEITYVSYTNRWQ
jgi:hypothetical protein